LGLGGGKLDNLRLDFRFGPLFPPPGFFSARALGGEVDHFGLMRSKLSALLLAREIVVLFRPQAVAACPSVRCTLFFSLVALLVRQPYRLKVKI
jgi:hypothetical protein